MVKLNNFLFLITFMVVLRGTTAPVLLKRSVSRDVPTGAPSSNGTIIPILIPLFPFLVYIHSRKLTRSMDGAKSGVLVRASRSIIILPDIIGRSSSETRARKASFRFVTVLHFLLLESKGDLSYLESFCGVLRLLFTLFYLRSAKLERRSRPNEQRRNDKSRQLMDVGHDQKAPIKMNISHGGVCIYVLGVLLSNTKKIEFIQRLPLGYELHMGKERCCLRGLDHLHGPTSHSICGNFMIYKYKPSLTNDRFEFYESLRADLLPIHFQASYENGHQWMMTVFPEKRYYRERTSTTEVAIHTNPFTDLYALIGTGSSKTGGWYTTIMKLPFISFIRIGFMLASLGGSRSLLRQLKKDQLRWNQ